MATAYYLLNVLVVAIAVVLVDGDDDDGGDERARTRSTWFDCFAFAGG